MRLPGPLIRLALLGLAAASPAAASTAQDERAVLRGEAHIDELACAACHPTLGDPELRVERGPELAEAGWRIDPAYLRAFLLDPSAVHPGTRMPAMLDGLAEGERAEAADALSQFLASLDARPHRAGEPEPAERTRGAQLFHEVGCVACHPARLPPQFQDGPPPIVRDAVPIRHVGQKYGVESLTEFLFQPTHVRPSGRMPDLGLTRSEARAIASYLLAGRLPAAEPPAPDPAAAETGRAWFARLGCATCHPLPGFEVSPPGTPDELDPLRGCLAPDAEGVPRYALDDDERAAIRLALVHPTGERTEAERLEATLHAFRCLKCHERDGAGGVSDELDPYFTTSEPGLGDEARIPPPLTGAGAKLRRDWLAQVLFDSASARPYMHARMPQFGASNLEHLPALFESVDAGAVPEFEMPSPEREAARTARDAGRELMGIRGLSCISCHDFKSKPSPNYRGVDLVNTCERLRPEWFAAFLLDPQGMRPGILMPQSWEGGVASHQGILDGDTDAQIRALWFFLSEGRTARDPEGLRRVDSKLEVGEAPVLYRGRSRVAGFRGIAVGFPSGLSFGFDARHGSLAAIWRGDFVSVRWDGQGAGDWNPAARPVELARDLAFYRLAAPDEPWPRMPVLEGERPINPDPDYPRDRGYRFRGYSLGDDGVPTLRYESGPVAIEERTAPHVDGERELLRRALVLEALAPTSTHFRVLAGELEQHGERAWGVPGVRVHLPPDATLVRRDATETSPAELLLVLELPAGATRLTIDYELVD